MIIKNPSEVAVILELLSQAYPQAHCELNFTTPFELLVATVLSAQSTDQRVNKVTARLFAQHRTPAEFLRLSQADLEAEIQEIGLFRSKAKNILAACRALREEFGGAVPRTLPELMSLPGVGRKTAKVVLSNAFGIPALAVDTHVFRVANRLGLAQSTRVEETERQLEAVIPREQWIQTHHRLIWHGRRRCGARKPACEGCTLQAHCEYFCLEHRPK
ncbi:DNA-(apurinic or apyrimidinic site) lyase [Acididesulfobacillus acetoxydans]|uniref:Endonuclease III n=1 Tax=Acididesulfobacillus acetoxydans TaxID=1561005 RepID=A0A8S0W2W1_9FIRM|nr:endonuclease III [Acididesulfobacillus acetoxydans]CAA7601068.1 DNA-(apurinic or apyrimidinic site) lyase [Acididesulfobacillus acetoxydans]CEJ06942.1 Endonuclease III [Acididesulfobacillus acetoxydans]